MHILYCYTVMAICSGKTISITADTYYTRLRYSVLAVTNTVTVYNVYYSKVQLQTWSTLSLLVEEY